ncbi:MAG: TonB-dependent receptor [Deltaproteobacteria bacterium]|nr:TonB-dependent receptor [Deltaproteobacteria bacterium]
MRSSSWVAFASLVLLADAQSASAQDPPEEPEEAFEEGLVDYVSVSTKLSQATHLTPASISVVSAEEIRAAGYRSVGEALGSVPGFFVSDDLLNAHAGVRGLFGGARSGSRMLKVMINGRAVSSVQSGTYLLGSEFIPIEAVERIEVMRGPASALYGAGALAGAINVVTKRAFYEGETTFGGSVTAGGAVDGQRGALGSLLASVTGESFAVTAGASGSYADRSGMVLPEQSPFFARYTANNVVTQSTDDIATPFGLFAQADAVLAGGRLSGMYVGQLSLRDGEFHDLSVLSHNTSVAVYNHNLSLAYDRPFASGFGIRGLFGLALGGPLASDQLDPNPAGEVYTERQFSSTELAALVEALYDFGNGGYVLAGVEAIVDWETISAYSYVNRSTGATTPQGDPPDPQLLRNFAGYAQILYPVLAWLSLSATGRFDHQSVYGAALSGRAGLVLSPTRRLSVKLLGGRSYKAPSPEQLFANPVTQGDIRGSTDIEPQYINGAEGSIDFFPADWLHLSGAMYFNFEADNLAYVRSGGFLVPTSFDADTLGGELSVQAIRTFSDDFHGSAGFSVSLQSTRTEERLVAGLPEKAVPDNETFPTVMLKAKVGATIRPAYLGVHAELAVVGERTPSQSNLLANSSVDLTRPNYALGSYHLLNVALTSTPIPLPNGSLELQARVTNLLGEEYAEVGFNGVDVPGLGRTFWLIGRFVL